MKEVFHCISALVVAVPCGSGTLNLRTILYRNVQQFRGGLVFKAHRLLYHSTLGLRVIKNRRGGLPLHLCPGRGRPLRQGFSD